LGAARGAVRRVTLELFLFAIIRAMELTTILNHGHHHPGSLLSG
jgi:hypothetical protein